MLDSNRLMSFNDNSIITLKNITNKRKNMKKIIISLDYLLSIVFQGPIL